MMNDFARRAKTWRLCGNVPGVKLTGTRDCAHSVPGPCPRALRYTSGTLSWKFVFAMERSFRGKVLLQLVTRPEDGKVSCELALSFW